MVTRKKLVRMFMKAYGMPKEQAEKQVDSKINDFMDSEVRRIEDIKFEVEGLSLFNGHVNNAAERARKDMINKYGPKVYEKHIGQYKPGIMVIMEHEENEFNTFYINRVHEYANGTWDY